MIVYLWDAGTWCGVSGSMKGAMDAAAERKGDGGARVERAVTVTERRSLRRVYQRTGTAWTVQPGTGTWREISGRRSVTAHRGGMAT
jgi:hypothetical protein